MAMVTFKCADVGSHADLPEIGNPYMRPATVVEATFSDRQLVDAIVALKAVASDWVRDQLAELEAAEQL